MASGLVRAAAVALVCVFAGVAQAQPGGGGGEGRQGRGGFGRGGGGFGFPTEELREELGLSDEQVAQIEAMQAEMREKGEELRELFQQGDMEGGREKMRELREESEARLNEILTEEQQGQYQTWREERRGRRGRGGPGGRGRGPSPEQLKERLLNRAMETLALEAEEAAVLQPMIESVIDTRSTVRQEADTRREEFLTNVRATEDADELQALLDAYRQAGFDARERELAAMDELREFLTVEQEAKLVALNVLD